MDDLDMIRLLREWSVFDSIAQIALPNPNPGEPDVLDGRSNVVTAPGLAPTGNRHERRKAAALKRRRG